MSAARQLTRTVPRFAAQLRAPAQRRLASTTTENAFIKEREHIKEHAKGTTGECLDIETSQLAQLDRSLTIRRALEEDLRLVRSPTAIE